MDNFDDYLSGKKKLKGNFDFDGCKITVHSTFDKVYIQANREGLICLAKFLIEYAYDEKEIYPDDLHLYVSSKHSTEVLDENSEELIIKKLSD